MRVPARAWFWALVCAAVLASVGCAFPEYGGFNNTDAAAGGTAGAGAASGGAGAGGIAGTGGFSGGAVNGGAGGASAQGGFSGGGDAPDASVDGAADGDLDAAEEVGPNACDDLEGGAPEAGCDDAAAPETDAQVCAQHSMNCGRLVAWDRCGKCHVIKSCGTCAAPQTCGGGGKAGMCGCTAETDDLMCKRLFKNCGSLTADDNCGISRTVTSCGICTGTGVSCGGGGTANVCACNDDSDAAFCLRLGKNCGQVTANDKCGVSRIVSCGTCSGTDTCGGGGTANVCGCSETDAAMCTRLSKTCGPVTANDKCGASRTVDSCGTCTGTGQACTGGVCSCTPETDAQMCTRLVKNCGTFTAYDNCGTSRTTAAPCGTCSGANTCGGGGTSNVCGCLPETDAAMCLRLGKNCNTLTDTDNCGSPRTTATPCGTCTGTGITCGGGGTPNVCGGIYDLYPPFLVDAAGYGAGWNNGTWGNWGTLTSGTCDQRMPATPAAGSNCHHWTYTYNPATGSDCSGVAVVPPATSCTNTTEAWKLATGVKTIAPGATGIQFYAWGTGTVTFGGAGQPGLSVQLTATPTQYTVPITVSYAGTAYVFSIYFTSAYSGMVINVDDIRWMP